MSIDADAVLNELPPEQPLKIERAGKPALVATPKDLMRIVGFPGFLTLGEVEFALSDRSLPGCNWEGYDPSLGLRVDRGVANTTGDRLNYPLAQLSGLGVRPV